MTDNNSTKQKAMNIGTYKPYGNKYENTGFNLGTTNDTISENTHSFIRLDTTSISPNADFDIETKIDDQNIINALNAKYDVAYGNIRDPDGVVVDEPLWILITHHTLELKIYPVIFIQNSVLVVFIK